MFIAPFVIIVIAAVLLFGFVGDSFSNVMGGGTAYYDEATLQAYADDAYSQYFGDNDETYEDNLLICFLANEEADGYDCIAWIGDNVRYEIADMFGGRGTAFGDAVYSSVNGSYYAYSLDSDLASVMNEMAAEVEALGLSSSFKQDDPDALRSEYGFYNRSELSLTENTVTAALRDFTERTDIPVVIVVDTVESVYGKTVPASDVITVVISVGLIVLAIALIVRAVKKRGNGDWDEYGGDDGWQPPKL